jgi:NAD(P)-dependent dehydrogenase (short-subunit alcohol dehydrogenase family)
MVKRVALVVGVGSGLGAALARRFAGEGFRVVMIARSGAFIYELARELSGTLALRADASNPAEMTETIQRAREELGPIGVLIYNASTGGGGGLVEMTVEQFEQSWRVSTLGAFVCAREVAPDMIEAGEGVMLFTGATSSVRGGGWLAFSSAKFALRGLVQSAARELWPKGVHVAHIVIDGLIGEAGDGSVKEAVALNPDRIADAYWYLAQQNRSAWTLELDLRPNAEEFFV